MMLRPALPEFSDGGPAETCQIISDKIEPWLTSSSTYVQAKFLKIAMNVSFCCAEKPFLELGLFLIPRQSFPLSSLTGAVGPSKMDPFPGQSETVYLADVAAKWSNTSVQLLSSMLVRNTTSNLTHLQPARLSSIKSSQSPM